MVTHQQPSAALIVIASEVLSGRTKDRHIDRLALWTRRHGIALQYACVIPDNRQAIIEAIARCRLQFDHIFTAGGLGATHDDITVSAVAEALQRPMERNPGAEAALRAHYGYTLQEAHLKLAQLPRGAELIIPDDQRVGVICVENLILLAGIPDVADAMLDALGDRLAGGPLMLQETIGTSLQEETFAAALRDLQCLFPQCNIASYPLWRGQRAGTNIVLRCLDDILLARCCKDLTDTISRLGGTIVRGGMDRTDNIP